MFWLWLISGVVAGVTGYRAFGDGADGVAVHALFLAGVAVFTVCTVMGISRFMMGGTGADPRGRRGGASGSGLG